MSTPTTNPPVTTPNETTTTSDGVEVVKVGSEDEVTNNMKYPCPVCGYYTFPGPPGTYEICPVCDWEDSLLQAQHPRMQGVANGFCIFGKQHPDERRRWVLPHLGNDNEHLERDPTWRLLREDEAPLAKDQLASDMELDYYAGAPPYYWRMPPTSP